MISLNNWFGFVLYTPHIDDNSLGSWVHATLVSTNGIVGGVPLYKLCTTSVKSGRSGKYRVVDEKTLDYVLKRGGQGKINRIYGHDSDLDPNAFLEFLEYLDFTLVIQPAFSTENRYLSVVAAKRFYNQMEVLSYLSNIVSDIEVDYGFVVSGWDFHNVNSKLEFTHAWMMDEYSELIRRDPNNIRFQFDREISYYQSRWKKFGQYIPRASWGNILSPTHVEALGGEERICKESGAYHVERWGNNLYLQLTESLWDCTNEDLYRLNEFFKPALFPDAPEPVFL